MLNLTRVYWTLIILLFLIGCAKPKQPPLTDNEQQYFSDLRHEFHCGVGREVDPRKSVKSGEKGYYLMYLDSIPCDILTRTDSLKHISLVIANKLHKDVLGKEFKYPYKELMVIFICNTGPGSDKRKSFSFDPNEL